MSRFQKQINELVRQAATEAVYAARNIDLPAIDTLRQTLAMADLVDEIIKEHPRALHRKI